MNESKERHIIDVIFVIALFCIFVLSAIFLISIGADIYSDTMSNMDANFNSRTAVAYINEKLRQSDENSSIHIGNLDGCEAVIITSYVNDKEYLTYIYEYDHQLMELMVRSDIQLSPAAGQSLIDVNSFVIEKVNDNLIKFTIEMDNDDDYTFYTSIHAGGLNYES